MVPDDDFPSPVTVASVYAYVRDHMRGAVPLYYNETYIAAVLEYESNWIFSIAIHPWNRKKGLAAHVQAALCLHRMQTQICVSRE
jgi:hypothetical protein